MKGGEDIEIRSLEIDFDKGILNINGKAVTDRPVKVTLPGPSGWPLHRLFNAGLAAGSPEECDKLKIVYKKAANSTP